MQLIRLIFLLLFSALSFSSCKNESEEIKPKENQRKVYVTNQGCDIVTILDADSRKIIKNISVGNSNKTESPHQIKVSHDGKYWYVIFIEGNIIQKFDSQDDSFVEELDIGFGKWSTLNISMDNSTGYVVDWRVNGSLTIIDLGKMKVTNKLEGLDWAHGSEISDDGKNLYVTAQHGNYFYKIDLKSYDIEKISLNTMPPTTMSFLDPNEVIKGINGEKLYFACQKSNEIRIVNGSNYELIENIEVGEFPQEMAISESLNYLFVTCTEDISTFPGKTGSVYVIDLNTNKVIKKIHTGTHPHGIAIDEVNNLVFISNRNINWPLPLPPHSPNCNGENGSINLIDLNTLELVTNYTIEVSVDPFSVELKD